MKKNNPMFNEHYKKKIIDITKSLNYKLKMSKLLHNKWSTDDKFRQKIYEGWIKSGIRIPKEKRNEWKKYQSKVYYYTRRSIFEFNHIINPKNKPIGIGNGFYNIDHKFSIIHGFNKNIDPKIIGSHINLTLMTSHENLSKNSKSSISLDELLNLWKEFNNEKFL